MATPSDKKNSRKSIFGRISRFLFRLILSLVLAIILLIGVIHLPSSQRWFTGKLSSWLTDKTGGKVAIDQLRFTLLADVEILGLELYDPGRERFFSSNRIVAEMALLDIFKGNLHFSAIEISGLDGHLIQHEKGLNIKYIIDAFRPVEEIESDEQNENTGLIIQFGTVVLEDMIFRFNSLPADLDLVTEVRSLKLDSVVISVNPNNIAVKQIYLGNTDVNLRMPERDTKVDSKITATVSQIPFLDFGSGFDFDIKKLELENNRLSFHVGQVNATEKFDPNHLDMEKINIQVSNLKLMRDTLGADIENFSSILPGYSLEGMKARVYANLQQLNIEDLKIRSPGLEVNLQFHSSYDSLPTTLNDLDKSEFQLSLDGSLETKTLNYFLRDSISRIFQNWPGIELELDVAQSGGSGVLNKLKLKSGNSFIEGSGAIIDVFNQQNLSWNELEIKTTVGRSFRNLISIYLKEYDIPQKLTLDVLSSGSREQFQLEGNLWTSLGNLKAKGSAGLGNDVIALDLAIIGENIEVGKLIDLEWLGPITISTKLKGRSGQEMEIDLEGSISEMILMERTINTIDFNGLFNNNILTSSVNIHDSRFTSQIDAKVEFSESLNIQTKLKLENVKLGELILRDTSFEISGEFNTDLIIAPDNLQAAVLGNRLDLKTSTIDYQMDSLGLLFTDSITGSFLEFRGENISAIYSANFDIRQLGDVLISKYEKYADTSAVSESESLNRKLKVELNFDNPIPFQIMGIEIKDFSELSLRGDYIENQDLLSLQATLQNFEGFNISFDSLCLKTDFYKDSVGTELAISEIYYDSLWLGDLDVELVGKVDSLVSTANLMRDSTNMLVLGTTSRLLPDGIHIDPDTLVLLDYGYHARGNNPVIINNESVLFDQFRISRNDMEVVVDGNQQEFGIDVTNVSLDRLNYLLEDTTIINSGMLNGKVFLSQPRHQVDLVMDVDNLVVYEYPPIKITGIASTEGSSVPFKFDFGSATNNIGLSGNYLFRDSGINADLKLDLNDLHMFEFLIGGYLDEMSGGIVGNSHITGTFDQPVFNGNLHFNNVHLTKLSPWIMINIRDETIEFDNSGISLENFTVYDQNQNPLAINGFFKAQNFMEYNYDISINTDNYLLINNQNQEEGQMQGYLVISSDLNISGNESDTKLNADILIRDSTDITYVVPAKDIELVTSEGIVEFVDPDAITDSTFFLVSKTYIDSLLATIPNFELTSNISLEENAVLKILLDPRSGDYIQTSGNADLQIGLNRTGNLQLAGVYTIKDGSYHLSFYDLVKRKFTIASGSSITWKGDPGTGDLNVRALHTIKTSSTGLIAREVSESEKALYRRSLPYEVSIYITGSIDNPKISFGLDLPQEDKTNFPVLANKLNRLQQPEFESELNKQVFGLLVLGGFIPETSGAEFNQSLVATTAITNSVNSILASQLNRFASQYVKGVDIHLGLQSYNDFSTGSGQTRTSMGVKVSKRMMDDRLSFEVGGGMDISSDLSGPNRGSDNFRGDIAIIYDLTESGNKQLKAFNNESYDIIYQQIRNTGVSLIFIREFDEKKSRKKK